jgi:ribosomal protein L37AE/L43A
MIINGHRVGNELVKTNPNISTLVVCPRCSNDKYYRLCGDTEIRVCSKCETSSFKYSWTTINHLREKRLQIILEN